MQVTLAFWLTLVSVIFYGMPLWCLTQNASTIFSLVVVQLACWKTENTRNHTLKGAADNQSSFCNEWNRRIRIKSRQNNLLLSNHGQDEQAKLNLNRRYSSNSEKIATDVPQTCQHYTAGFFTSKPRTTNISAKNSRKCGKLKTNNIWQHRYNF